MSRRPQQRENKSLSVARPLAVGDSVWSPDGRRRTHPAGSSVHSGAEGFGKSAHARNFSCGGSLHRFEVEANTHVTRPQTLLAINPLFNALARTHAGKRYRGPFWQAASWLGAGRTGAVQEKQSGPARALGLLCLWSVTLHHERNLLRAREELWSSGRGVWESPLRLPPMSAPIFWLPTISWI